MNGTAGTSSRTRPGELLVVQPTGQAYSVQPKRGKGNYPMEPPSIKQMVLDSSMEPIPKYKCFNTKTDHFTYANWMHF